MGNTHCSPRGEVLFPAPSALLGPARTGTDLHTDKRRLNGRHALSKVRLRGRFLLWIRGRVQSEASEGGKADIMEAVKGERGERYGRERERAREREHAHTAEMAGL